MPVCPKCRQEYLPGVSECADCKVALVEGPLAEKDVSFVELYTCPSKLDAEQARTILEENGIDCNLRELESSAFPMGAGLMSPVRLVVPKSDIDAAADLIRERVEKGTISDKGSFVEGIAD